MEYCIKPLAPEGITLADIAHRAHLAFWKLGNSWVFYNEKYQVLFLSLLGEENQ